MMPYPPSLLRFNRRYLELSPPISSTVRASMPIAARPVATALNSLTTAAPIRAAANFDPLPVKHTPRTVPSPTAETISSISSFAASRGLPLVLR